MDSESRDQMIFLFLEKVLSVESVPSKTFQDQDVLWRKWQLEYLPSYMIPTPVQVESHVEQQHSQSCFLGQHAECCQHHARPYSVLSWWSGIEKNRFWQIQDFSEGHIDSRSKKWWYYPYL